MFELDVSNGEVTELLTHPSGESVLAVVDKERLYHVDLKHWSVAEINLSGGEGHVVDVLALSSDGKLLATAGDGILRVWDTDSREAWEPRATHDDTVGILRFTADDTRLLISSGATVSRWALIDGSLVYDQRMESYAGRRQCIITVGDVSNDGSLLMTGDDCGQYRAWDLAAGAEIYIPQLHDSHGRHPINVLEFSPDGRVLYVGNYYGFGLLIIHQPE